MRKLVVASLVAVLAGGCTALEQLRLFVQPPRFEQASERPAEIRLLTPSGSRPLGGAGVRLWAHIANPNPFGFTLSTLSGTLFLEDAQAATAEFPLGLPLGAGADTTVPLDLTIDFRDVADLASTLRRTLGRQPVGYRLDGTIGVDAGRYGRPTFGPMTLMRGDLSSSASLGRHAEDAGTLSASLGLTPRR
jgi:hypothetical protein